MKEKIKIFCKDNYPQILVSFFVPMTLLFLVYLSIGVYWGSSRSVLASDAFSQFSNFHASMNNVLHGKQGFLYAWNASLGLNFLPLYSYYLGGIFTPLVFFFKNENMPNALYLITLLKVGSAGFTMWLLLRHILQKVRPWGIVALSVPYPLMSFAMAHSEIIMWLDAFVWLPLIILGIHLLVEKNHRKLLFFSYFFLFVSNFYMGFMIGMYSLLYFLVQLFTRFSLVKKRLIGFMITGISSVLASMILLLPVLFDLRENGEELSKITHLKTEATGLWDFFMKNFLGSYDGTKYGSIPFIYIGLLPLLFFFYYFLSRNITIREKIGFGLLITFIYSSFYFQPLNLFWQGFHSPNMFLFRFAYLFSFTILLLGARGMDVLTGKEMPKFFVTGFVLMALFAVAFAFGYKEYSFVKTELVLLTFIFLVLYLTSFYLFEALHYQMKHLLVLLFVLMSCEALINTKGEIEGILEDWNYASASLYEAPQQEIATLVERSKKRTETFYRLENLSPISSNDSLNFGYHGLSMFNSIRNRHSSHFMDLLGFKSAGTNLNIRYANNTLLMDSLVGMKYNISDHLISKYGFSEVSQAGNYHLYENKNALPLGILTSEEVLKFKPLKTDNLSNQTTLLNQLSGQLLEYFHFETPELTKKSNVKVTTNADRSIQLQELQSEVTKKLFYQVKVRKNTQAYLSLFPTDTNEIGTSTVSVRVMGVESTEQMDITGQYYPIGFFKEDTTVLVEVSFTGSKSVRLLEPKVLVLDTLKYQSAIDTIMKKAPKIKQSKRQVEFQVKADQSDNLLYTTIPYDKGWRVKVNGKKEKIKPAQDAFLAVKLPAGENKVVFTYFPYGLDWGIALFVLGNLLFWGSERFRKEYNG